MTCGLHHRHRIGGVRHAAAHATAGDGSGNIRHAAHAIGTRPHAVTAPAPAATVILLRESSAALEVLLLRRSSQLAFHGGAWVFPGGRVDPEDLGDDGDEPAARRAAAREAREEAGVEVDPDALVAFSHWTTPEG